MSSNSSRKKPSGPSVIIEIGNDWLKMVQAEPSKDGISISRLHLQKISSFGTELSRSISNALKQKKFAKTPVIACLPRQVVNVRMLEFPSTDPGEIADMVDLQVGKQTPYSKDEIVSDYKILGSEREGYSRVMLVIVQKGVLRQRFSVFEEAGIEVKRMSVSSEGLMNWCVYSIGGIDKVTAILDIDSSYTDFAVVSRGGLIFTRSVLIGANQLMEDYTGWKEKLAREIKQSLELCQSESHGKTPVRLVISGAGANIPDLKDYLAGQLNLQTDIRDSRKTAMKWPSQPLLEDAEFSAVSMTTMIGAGMAPQNLDFNLVPDSILLRKDLITKAKTLTAFGVLVMTLLVSVSLYGVLKLCFKRDTLNRIEKELREMEPAVRNVGRMQEIIRVDRDRRNARFSVVNLVSEIHKLVPGTVTLDLIGVDLDKEKGQVGINGESPSMEDVQSLVSGLERSDLFKDVKDNTNKGEGGAVFKFKIECALQK